MWFSYSYSCEHLSVLVATPTNLLSSFSVNMEVEEMRSKKFSVFCIQMSPNKVHTSGSMFFKVEVASIILLIVKNSVFLDLLRNLGKRLISWEEGVGVVVLPLMGEEGVDWL